MKVWMAALWVIVVLLHACDEVETAGDKNNGVTYIIPQGEHYAKPRRSEFFSDNVISFYASFDSSARYDLGDASLQSNHNKLLGISDCGEHHHQNSARFAWRWYKDELQIHAYAYIGGERITKYVGTVAIDEENHYEIRRTPDAYVFVLNGEQTVRIPRDSSCPRSTNYMLYPYFGGSAPAPHEVRVRIRK